MKKHSKIHSDIEPSMTGVQKSGVKRPMMKREAAATRGAKRGRKRG